MKLLKKLKYIFTILLTTSLLVVEISDYSSVVKAAVSRTINYQGYIQDNSGNPLTGTYTIQFSLYNDSVNGTPADTPSAAGPLLWTETYDQNSGNCAKINVSDGYVRTALGSCNPFPLYLLFDQDYYLGIKIESDNEASPRVVLHGVPFAENVRRITFDDGFNDIFRIGTPTEDYMKFDTTNAKLISMLKDLRILSGLLDNAGSYGTSGQVLSSTGSGVAWVDDKDNQSLSWDSTHSILSISGGNSVDLSSLNSPWVSVAYDGTNNTVYGGNTLIPKDGSSTKGLVINSSDNAINTIRIINKNDSDNYAGAALVLKGSGNDYRNQLYFGIFGQGFYQTPFQNTALLKARDKDLYIGTHSDNPQNIRFFSNVDNTTYQPSLIATFNGSGVYFNSLQTLGTKPANAGVVMADLSTGQLVAVSQNTLNSLFDTDNDTGIQVEESPDEDIIRMDTAGTQRLMLDATGNFLLSNSEPADLTNPGNLHALLFRNDKSAFRVGEANNNEWNDSNVGTGSFAAGRNNIVSGNYSAAFGGGNNINEVYATAFGRYNTVTGSYAVAGGYQNTASGNYSTVWGAHSTASGTNATAFGYYSNASGNNSTAIGDTVANSYYMTAVGRFNVEDSSQTPDSWVDTDYLFVVGNGSGFQSANRRNALSIFKNGKFVVNAPADEALLTTHPTGGVPLAIATVGYVNSHVGTSIFDADADTGIQVEANPDEDYIRMQTAGVERVIIDNVGNMGVGLGGQSLNSLLQVGPGTSEASTFAVNADPNYMNIATFRDQDGENVFRAMGSLANDDLIVTFGDWDWAYDHLSFGINSMTDSLEFYGGDFRLYEFAGGQFDYVGFRAPNDVTSSVVWTLPAADGGNGYLLQTDGSGHLSWVDPGTFTNIYTSDGTLQGDREVNTGGYSFAIYGDKPSFDLNEYTVSLDFYDTATDSEAMLGLASGFSTLQYDPSGPGMQALTLDGTDMIVRDDLNYKGLVYEGDYEANFVARSLVTKQYVDNAITTNAPNIYNTNGSLTAQRTVDLNGNNLLFTGAGNIGVGTTSPNYVLDITGDVNTSSVYRVNGNPLAIDHLADAQNNATNNNLFLGHAGFSGTYYNQYNTVVGLEAFTNPNTDNSQSDYGNDNVAIGYQALTNNTTGYSNTAIGRSVLTNNTTGYYNTGIGRDALNQNTTGYSNSAFGRAALFYNTTGTFNTAVGVSALYSNTDGYRNVANGSGALYFNTGGYFNTALGAWALYNNTTGVDNVAVGANAGRFIADGTTENQTGSNNVLIGVNTKPLADGDTNEIVIGYDATGIGSDSIVIGNDNIQTTALKGNVGIGTTTPGALLEVNGGDLQTLGGNIITNNALVARGTGTNGEAAHLVIDAQASTLHRLIEARNNNGAQFVVDGNNRVGIGVNNPGAPLHIRNTQSNTEAVMILQNTNGDYSSIFEVASNPEGNITAFRGDLAIDGLNGDIYIKNSNDNTNTGWVKLLEEGDILSSIWDTDEDTGIQVEESADEDIIRFDIGDASGTAHPNAMVIDSDANVGINTTSPTQRLHVDGNFRLTGAFYDASNASGTSGQILSSTGSGTSWVDLNTLQLGSIDQHSDVDTSTNAPTTNQVLAWDGLNWVPQDISGLETVTTVTNTVAGHKIADYTNEQGLITAINETVTSLALNGNSLDYADENGNITNIDLSGYAENIYNTNGSLVTERIVDLNGNNLLFAGTGNIGIGVTNPVNKLQVNGNVRATRFLGADGTQGSPSFRFNSDSNTGMFLPATDTLAFTTNGSERFRINQDGLLTYGTTITDYNLAYFGTQHSVVMINQDPGSMATYASVHYGDDDEPGRIAFLKARGGEGSEAALQNGDKIAEFSSAGYDGSQYMTTGGLRIVADGSVSTNNLPSRLEFLVNSGGGNLGSDVEMILDHNGNLGIGTTPASGYKLDVHGSVNIFSDVHIGARLFDAAGSYGSNGQVLTVSSGVVTWQNPVSCVIGGAKIQANGTVTNSYGNVASVTHSNTGRYRINFTNSLNTDDYYVHLTKMESISTRDDVNIDVSAYNTDYVDVIIHEGDNGTAANVYRDRDFAVTIFDANCTALSEAGNPSDARLKTNIQTIQDPLSLISNLRGVRYNWNTAKYPNRKDFDNKPEIGLIAQEVKDVVPEVVNVGDDGYYRIEYGKMVGLLVEGIKSQQNEIVVLQHKTSINSKFSSLVSKVLGLENQLQSLQGQEKAGNSGTPTSSPTPTNIPAPTPTDVPTASTEEQTEGQANDSNISDNSDTNSNSEQEAVLTTPLSKLVNGIWNIVNEVIFKYKVTFEKLVVFMSNVKFNKRVQFADKDMAGYAVIKAGDQKVHVKFEQPYEYEPVINITSVGLNVDCYIKNITTNGFDIIVDQIYEQDLKFTWLAINVKEPQTTYSNGLAGEADSDDNLDLMPSSNSNQGDSSSRSEEIEQDPGVSQNSDSNEPVVSEQNDENNRSSDSPVSSSTIQSSGGVSDNSTGESPLVNSSSSAEDSSTMSANSND